MTLRSWHVCVKKGPRCLSIARDEVTHLFFIVLSFGRSSSRLDVGIDSVAIVSTVGQKSPEGDINCSSVASSGDRYEMKAYAGEF